MKKRLISLLVTLTMVLGSLPTTTLAAGNAVVWAGAMNFNDANNQVMDLASFTDAAYTELKWDYPLNTTVENYGAYYASTQVIVGDYLYATGGNKLHKVDINTGECAQSVNSPITAKTNEVQYLCYGGGFIYVAIRESITAFSLADLTQQWQVTGDFGQYHPVQYLEYDGDGYIWCNGNVLKASNGDKVTIQQKDTDDALDSTNFAWSSGAQVGDYFYVTDKINIYAVDMRTWKVADQSQYFSGTINSSCNTSGQAAYDSASQRLFWGCKSSSAKNLYSIKVSDSGTFAADSLKTVEAGVASVNLPVIHNGKIYLVGQGRPFVAVFTIDAETDEISLAYSAGSASTTVQTNPVLSAASGTPRLYFFGFDAKLYVLEDNGTEGTLIALAQSPNPSNVQYPNAYEQFAMDANGRIYCYNESGYLFCYGVSNCEVPQITTDLSATQVKYGLNVENAPALCVEASVSDGGTLSYQWQSSTDRDVWADIADATEASYIPSVDTEGTTYYRVRVTNTKGGNTAVALSTAAEVLVKVLGTDTGLFAATANGNNVATASVYTPLTPKEGAAQYYEVCNVTTSSNRLYLGTVDDDATIGSWTILDGTKKNLSNSGKTASDGKTYSKYVNWGNSYSGTTLASAQVTAEDGAAKETYYFVVSSGDGSDYGYAAGVTLDKTTHTFDAAGDTLQLNVTRGIKIGTGTDEALSWTSSNETVATVDSNGLVTCTGNGKATITVSGALGVSASCAVTAGKAAEDITVYVTIANAGSTVKSKDGRYAAQAAVTVSDFDANGTITVEETLRAAHETLYDGGAAAGYASENTAYGRSITKLWGDENGCYGYWRNNGSCWSLEDAVSDNDHVKAFVYADKINWSDVYTAFTQNTATATVGEEFTLTLNGYSWNNDTYAYAASPYEGAKIRILGGNVQNVTTNSVGQAQLTIAAAGEYIVEAYTDEASIVPAVCKVTVSGSQQSGGGDTQPDEDPITISFVLRTHNATWISAHNVELEEGATVADAFHTVMDDRDDFSYEADSNYVRAITHDGTTLGEFDQGPNSGWKYMVNGVAPGVGMMDKTLEDGDALVWYYVVDYTQDTDRDAGSFDGKEESEDSVTLTPEVETNRKGEATAEVTAKEISNSMKQAEEENVAAIVVAPDVSGVASKVTVELPKTAVKNMADNSDLNLTVETALADMTISNQGLAELAKQDGSNIAISAENIKDEKGEATGEIRVEVSVDGEVVGTIPGGIDVAIPSESSAPGKVLVLVNADGTQTILRKSTVDKDFNHHANIPGSATVKIIDNSKNFVDVESGSTFCDAVAFVTARELMNGTTDGRFDGNAATTRAMVWTILGRGEGENLYGAGVFEQAKDWAQTTAVSDGSNPDGKVSRQQLATMLWRQAGSPDSDYSLEKFCDAHMITDYAQTAIRWCVENGIMSGRANGDLDPQGPATRYHVAAMYMRYLSVMQ